MKQVINFINRTKESIFKAFIELRNRYRQVEFVYKMKNALCTGYFIVEGKGVKNEKWKN